MPDGPLLVELLDRLGFKDLLSSTPPETQSTLMAARTSMGFRAVELFAGVGGFRLGLEHAGWEVAWSNQWEPANRNQHASDCYVSRFGPDGHSNKDIATVNASEIPDHDLLVGGFPCQDYSVATTQAAGIQGKKGVLWWEILRILREKRPSFLLLENVDRLLKSPTDQRGRDFGIMLACLSWLGYKVEWRMLNAAEYGAPQKRRRTFIFGAHASSELGGAMDQIDDHRGWIQKKGFFASEFPSVRDAVRTIAPEQPAKTLPRDLQRISDEFSFPFRNAGVMTSGKIWSYQVVPKPEPVVRLESILEKDVPESFFVSKEALARWRYLKGAKDEKRKASNGFEYSYSEGPIPFPDHLDGPSRTLLTSEGGTSPSRFKHLILDPQVGRPRVLTPLECERLNQFPDNWTATSMPTGWRYYCMGNALVVGLVRRMAMELATRLGGSPTPRVRVRTAVEPITTPVSAGYGRVGLSPSSSASESAEAG